MIAAYAAFEPSGELKPFEFDPGKLEADKVEIDVLYCGICHSDLSMINNEWGISQYPLVPGHEIVGKISSKGDNVKNLEIGQNVGLGWHAGYCGHCYYCNTGDHNLCAGATSTIVGHHGGFAKQVRAFANSVVPIPEGMDLESSGPLYCGGITVFNPLVQFNVKPTDKVAVIGIGGLGHMALQFLNAWGCEVTAFTSSESKKQEALKMGALHTLNSRDEKEIEAAAGQFDLIISTVNVKLDWNIYINTLRVRGRLHFVGAAMDPLNINAFQLITAHRSISGSPVGSPATIAQMLDFAGRHNIKPVIETFTFEEVNKAIQHLQEGKARYRVVLKQ